MRLKIARKVFREWYRNRWGSCLGLSSDAAENSTPTEVRKLLGLSAIDLRLSSVMEEIAQYNYTQWATLSEGQTRLLKLHPGSGNTSLQANLL